jgi:tRNA nucleotidyltransferase (CCA-adding enzyme)
MHVILTHEQADFDALAALLAAALLNSRAVPVLPRRMNRNVRAFVNLYGGELPFIEPRDLNGDPIDRITLVDTQSLVTLKGMQPDAEIQVVDHHPLREDIDPAWSVTIETVGATTTRLVEDLQEHAGPLTSIQASLLLLGIYEDTGSLTYISTTPRDIRAAAFLLEQGASLRIINRFLNPPLSPEQRQLYERLVAAAVTHSLHDLTVVIASAPAEDLNEEVSSVAHKLRDLLDPDALFLLVGTPEGVRLVARSTTDQLDVSQVAAQFGGGGHSRAAAALVRTDDLPEPSLPLEWAQTRLLELLPSLIRPQVTVGQIMSHRPRLLAPETPVQEAAHLMQRYGYEGYPVVNAAGKVIGLLTRRAVDRTLSHRLNLTAASVMEGGEVVVRPEDSIEHLQRLMASTGWGQIPVIDEQSGAVIGIVTRTDLLKTIGREEPVGVQKPNLAARLETALPAGRVAFLKLIASVAHQKHVPVYIVGGFVRDLILGRPGLDFDIVVEGDAIALARALERKYGGRIVPHSRFGTAKWKIDSIRSQLVACLPESQALNPADLPDSLDLISARTEFYERPTALPVIERSNIKLDLHRRDFTINTLAMRLDGRYYGDLYDFWGGLNDINKRLVRVLHSISFIDDPTRMLRAVRFEQRFGFEIEARTLELVDEARPMLKQISGDRLRHEFDLILAEKQAAHMLARLDDLGLLAAIHPELRWEDRRGPLLSEPLDPAWELPAELDNQPIRRLLAYLIWLLPLKSEIAAEIAERLRFSRHLKQGLLDGSRLWQELSGLPERPPSQVVERLEGVSLPVLYALARLHPSAAARDVLYRFVTQWRKVQPHTTGDDLRACGLPPSPEYRAILQRLRAAWLDGEISTAEQESALLQSLLPTP